MIKKQKLELTWIGKDEQPVLEPRILIEDPSKSYGDAYSENMLIHGDNLLALKALEQKFAGKIKCVFIDPPYNTGSAFAHYDDGIEHSLWLSLIRDRLVLLRRLLSTEGSIWISIDDNEAHYLKVIMDEIFGRSNFLGTVTWQKTTSIHNNAVFFSSATDLMLCYAKDIASFKMGRVTRSERNATDYSNPDGDPRGAWSSSPLHVSLTSGQRGKQYAATGKSSGLFPIISPHGEKILPPKGRCWAYSLESLKKFENDKLIWWGKDGTNQPRLKRFLEDNKDGVVPTTLWLSEEVGHNQEAKLENVKLLSDIDQLFSTPKPERLVQRVLQISTNTSDLILDSFLGSGTTAAVAQKMGRKWIGIELGDHCDTHCLPRLRKVCDGTDQGGISKVVEWKGGGGFKYYDLAPSLLKQDKYGNFIISEDYNADMLAAAMAKQEGFTYAPSQECYWKQGFSTEQDFIFTTTNHVTQAMIDLISEEMAEGEHLLICCKKFSAGCDKRHSTIQIKKIPAMLMGRCEFGKEDYSFNIVNLTDETTAPAFVPKGPKEDAPAKSTARTHGNKNPNQMELF